MKKENDLKDKFNELKEIVKDSGKTVNEPKLDIKGINAIIKLTKRLLKIFLYIALILVIYAFIILGKESGIFKVLARESKYSLNLNTGSSASGFFPDAMYIDYRNKVGIGINALREYHKEFDEKNKVWRSKPKHDWSSNAADAFRYLANSLNLIGDGSDDEDYEEDDLFEGGYY
jgi:hypothetical protein